MSYIAGQIRCHECGHVELLIKRVDRPWARVRRCADCGSKHTETPVWFPVEDPRAISAAMSAEFKRAHDPVAIHKRRRMH